MMEAASAVSEEALLLVRARRRARSTRSSPRANSPSATPASGAAPRHAPCTPKAVELMASVRDWVHFSFGGLIVTALIANGLGEREERRPFLGAAAQCRAIIGFTPFAVQERFIGRATEEPGAGLGEAAYDAAFATGFT
ncbi:MAG: hypothetical protein U0841_18740 [Chloroflexia bacterium]